MLAYICLAVVLLLLLRGQEAGLQSMATLPRILCLHGKSSSGESLQRRLEPLSRHAELVCIDAPHPLGPGTAWWYLPAGERSFTTPIFEGWEKTLEYMKSTWERQGPFDGILGFSQGAILIAGLAALGVVGASPSAVMKPRFVVLFGSAVPGPFKRELSTLAVSKLETSSELHALHVIGAADDVNPPEGAHEVAAAMGGEVYVHPGAHEIPMDETSLQHYASFIASSMQR